MINYSDHYIKFADMSSKNCRVIGSAQRPFRFPSGDPASLLIDGYWYARITNIELVLMIGECVSCRFYPLIWVNFIMRSTLDPHRRTLYYDNSYNNIVVLNNSKLVFDNSYKPILDQHIEEAMCKLVNI